MIRLNDGRPHFPLLDEKSFNFISTLKWWKTSILFLFLSLVFDNFLRKYFSSWLLRNNNNNNKHLLNEIGHKLCTCAEKNGCIVSILARKILLTRFMQSMVFYLTLGKGRRLLDHQLLLWFSSFSWLLVVVLKIGTTKSDKKEVHATQSSH
jgi:hypothetical protein